LLSGELCTLLPFALNPNRGSGLSYERIWVETSDKEHLAIDWVLPHGGIDPDRPVVLLLPGLMPRTHWTQEGGFVADAIWHLTARLGMTAVVLVPRGSMGTPVREHYFHGARVSDIREGVLLAEQVLRDAFGETSAERLFAAGFSMGAITLANYCGRYGDDARLAGAVHFSGVYDGMANKEFEYSARTWQTFLCRSLKETFGKALVSQTAAKRGVDMERVLSRSVQSVSDLDEVFVAPFNGFRDLADYYRDLGLSGDDKWRKVRVPTLAIAARDDPITHCDSLHAAEYARGNANLLFLITERGGHCGWPLGWAPWRRGFAFSSEAISVFVGAVLACG